MAKRILIVDDSASMRGLQKMVLVQEGFEVVEAADGEDALRKLAGLQVALIITDINMPGLDGLGLIRAVRGGTSHRRTPIMIVTTESRDDRKAEARAAGATAWMVKPFHPTQLVATVRKVIG